MPQEKLNFTLAYLALAACVALAPAKPAAASAGLVGHFGGGVTDTRQVIAQPISPQAAAPQSARDTRTAEAKPAEREKDDSDKPDKPRKAAKAAERAAEKAAEKANGEKTAAKADEAARKVAYLGVKTQAPSGELAAQLKLDADVVLVVTSVDKGGPAEASGIKQYDVLTKLGDQIIVDIHQLTVLVRMNKPGDEVKFTVVRQAEARTMKVKLGGKNLPANEAQRGLMQRGPQTNRGPGPQGRPEFQPGPQRPFANRGPQGRGEAGPQRPGRQGLEGRPGLQGRPGLRDERQGHRGPGFQRGPGMGGGRPDGRPLRRGFQNAPKLRDGNPARPGRPGFGRGPGGRGLQDGPQGRPDRPGFQGGRGRPGFQDGPPGQRRPGPGFQRGPGGPDFRDRPQDQGRPGPGGPEFQPGRGQQGQPGRAESQGPGPFQGRGGANRGNGQAAPPDLQRRPAEPMEWLSPQNPQRGPRTAPPISPPTPAVQAQPQDPQRRPALDRPQPQRPFAPDGPAPDRRDNAAPGGPRPDGVRPQPPRRDAQQRPAQSGESGDND